MMEAVSWQFRIVATTFHTTSTRPMPQYSPFLLGVSTTSFHAASSASRPYPKAALTKATTFSQCVISFFVYVYLFLSVYSPSGPLIAAITPFTAFSTVDSSFCASASHPLRWSDLIPEDLPEQVFEVASPLTLSCPP